MYASEDAQDDKKLRSCKKSYGDTRAYSLRSCAMHPEKIAGERHCVPPVLPLPSDECLHKIM